MSDYGVSRRVFLMGMGLAAAGCSTALRPTRRGISPNEKLNIATIGVGGKGWQDLNGCSGENIVALCDVDDVQMARAAQAFPKARRYRDFRVMLEKQKDIDAVTVSIPDHMHALPAMMAMAMGKHVFVQKPLARTVAETRMLTKAARRYNVVTQMGNQGHSSDATRKLCEMIWSGAIGQVHEAHVWSNRPEWPQGIAKPLPPETVPYTLDWDLWLGVAPTRPYNEGYAPSRWRGWWDFGTCALGDMGCHIIDPVHWALRLGAPSSVEVLQQDGKNSQTGPLSSVIKYEFPGRGDLVPVTVYWHDGGNMPPRPEGIGEDVRLGEMRDGKNGSLFIGDKGIATAGKYGAKDPRLLPDDRMFDYTFPTPSIPRIEGDMKGHYADWIQACKGGRPACSNFNHAGPFTETVLLGNVALRVGQKITWNKAQMKIANLPEANRYLHASYRKGWRL
jgi:predicted dehydrogenase